MQPDPRRAGVAVADEVTPTGYALLGLLSYAEELSGYELKQWADASLRFFYTAPPMSQVYTELERLTAAGLVQAREVASGAVRRTRVHSITDAGRQQLKRWLSDEAVELPTLKHHLALRVFLGHIAGAERIRELLDEHRDGYRSLLADLRDVRTRLSDDPHWRWAALVAEWGIAHYEGEIAALDRLEKSLTGLPEPATEP
jgi:DNA-binding PadR family transcriptional regulator